MERVRGLADASLSVVRGNKARKDVMKIEVMENDEIKKNVRPVYALGTFEWSTFNDAFHQRDRYWYLASLRDYATFVFNAFNNDLQWKCDATISYTKPCAGCSNCFIKSNQGEMKKGNQRWWSAFIPSFRLGSSQSNAISTDYSKIQNADCLQQTTIECESAGILITTNQKNNSEKLSKLDLKLVTSSNRFGFVEDSWNRLNNKQIKCDFEYPIRTAVVIPKLNENTNISNFFYIDNESYEVKPVRITLLPNFINFYVL